MYFLVLFLFVYRAELSGQRLAAPVAVPGKIISQKTGSPVREANISARLSGTQTTSGYGGIFSIRLSESTDSLTVSYVGYKTAIIPVLAGTQDTLLIMLEESTSELQEVQVSTGYQQLPKERATGSFVTVSNKVFNQQVGSDVLSRLDGVASGVLFPAKADGPTLSVRGLSTINANKMPLIVLDNFPYEGDINNINPNEVEQVTILRDAAAASIWGARASNGVIVITTKKAKQDQPLKLSFNANIIQSPQPDLYYLPQLRVNDYIDLEENLYTKGYYNNELNSFDHKPLSPVVDILALRDNGGISSDAAKTAIDEWRSHDIRRAYDQYMYRPAFNQQYALNMSGDAGKLAYYLSGGFDHNAGELHQTYQRWNIRSNNVYQLCKGLQLTAGFTYTNTESKSGRPGYNQVLIGSRRIPYLSFADESGNPVAVAKDYRAAYTDTAGGGKLLDWDYYPLEEYRYNNTGITGQHMLANAGLQWRIGNTLRLEATYQYEQQQSHSRNLQEENSYAARNMVNRFSQLDYATGQVTYALPTGSILNVSDNNAGVHNLRGQVDYNNHWGDHGVVAIAGAELRSISRKGTANTIYGYNDDILLSSNIDFVHPYPIFTDGSYQNIPNNLLLSEQLNRYSSFYGNMAYTYKNRYTASVSARKDASNIFGVNTNDKWNPFWSAGLAWELSKELFYKLEAIHYLKFRATYGFSGNMDPNRSAVTTLMYNGPDIYTNLTYAQVDQFANPDLRWEKTGTFNLGVDFAAFKQRLWGSIDYFNKKSKDLFAPSVIDYTAGLNRASLIMNAASVTGNGVDVQLGGRIFNTKDFNWQMGLLFSYNKSITDSFYRSSPNAAQYIRDGSTISPISGKSLYSVISYAWAGLDKEGNPQGYLDGKASTDYAGIMTSSDGMNSLVYSGSAMPLYYGAWSNSLQYKRLALTVNVTYKLGYYYRRESINYATLLATGQGHPDYSERWQKPGDELITNVPSFVYPLVSNRDLFYSQSAINVHRADNIRLQFINLSYDFTLGKRTQQFQLYLNAANLGIIWQKDKSGYDPDYSSVLPPAKTFAIGLRGSF